MATWHQQHALRRNPVPFWHETKYTVVCDPPGEMRTFSTFATGEMAEEYLNNLKKHGNGNGCYILPPGKGGRK